jgi:hypothetical protein
MAARTPEVVKQELESERARLDVAVHALHRQAENVRRKLPFVAVGVAAVAALAVVARRRF